MSKVNTLGFGNNREMGNDAGKPMLWLTPLQDWFFY
jgi:hypothetical protein